jgi:hypothetical protein
MALLIFYDFRVRNTRLKKSRIPRKEYQFGYDLGVIWNRFWHFLISFPE